MPCSILPELTAACFYLIQAGNTHYTYLEGHCVRENKLTIILTYNSTGVLSWMCFSFTILYSAHCTPLVHETAGMGC